MDRDLRRRLARFDRPATAVRPPAPRRPPAVEGDPLRGLIEQGARWRGEAPDGHLRLERDLGPSPEPSRAHRLDPGLRRGPVAVIDTETTGLESGTGTLVFMVGVVHWEGPRQRLVQLVLPEPAGERGFLEAVVAEFAEARVLVSYNGRGFDLPRLRSRMRLHRIDESALDRPHLDLLYPARRLVRGWLPDARLKTVEEGLLGEVREDDLPGEFAPEVYRALQFESRDTGLTDVLRHNARDVENLPRLVLRLAAILDGDELDALPPSCALEATRAHLDRGDAVRAEAGLDRAMAGGDAGVRARARAIRARLLRRAGRHREAAREWEAQLAERPADLGARIELAKLLEHRLGDLPRALALVSEARTLLELRRDADPTLSESLDHRYRRLVRRLGRTS